MSDGLRAALEKLARECEVEAGIGGTLSYRSLSEDLARLLAAHPAEPALVVTEEAVKKAANVYWETEGNRAVCMRAALEAAAPLLGLRPLLDREALTEEIFRATPMQVSRNSSRDAADIALRLARPMLTREQIAKALHEHDMADVWDDEGCNDTLGGVHTSCKDSYLASAGAVLALINGGAK